MPTIVESTVGPGGSGATYTSFAAWYAAIPADLVAADELHRAILIGNLNDEVFVPTGKTVDATRYPEIVGQARYNPETDVGVRLTGNSLIRLGDRLRVRGFAMIRDVDGGACIDANAAAPGCIVDGMYLEMDLAADLPSRRIVTFFGGGAGATVQNCLLRSPNAGGRPANAILCDQDDVDLLNNTVDGYFSTQAISHTGGGTSRVENNIGINDDAAADFNVTVATRNANASTDGSGDITGIDPNAVFVNRGGNNYRLDAGATALINVGAVQTFTEDFYGAIHNADGSGFEVGCADAGVQPQGRLRLSQPTADAAANAVANQLELGVAAGGGYARALEGATLLGLIQLNEPGFTPASGDGTPVLDGPVTNPTADNSGTPNAWAFEDSDNVECFRVTNDITGDPVVAGNPITLTSYQFTVPLFGRN